MADPEDIDHYGIISECKTALMKASSREKAAIYVKMGDTYRSMNKGNKALVCYQEAFDTGELDPEFILKYAQQLADSGSTQDAVVLMDEAIQRTEDLFHKARMFTKHSMISRLTGEYEKGIEMGKRALELASGFDDKKADVKSLKAEANTVIALNLWRQGRFGEAKPYLETALGLYLETGEKKGIADVYNHLGIVNSLMGDQERALECYDRSREAMDKARCYINIGIVKQIMGQFDEAEKNLRVALQKGRAEGYKIAIHLAQLNLAEIDIDKENPTKAKVWVDLANQGYNDMDENPRVALVMNAKAKISLLLGDIDEAMRIADKALWTAETYKLLDAKARILHTLGVIAQAKQKYNKAQELLEASHKLMKKINLVRYLGRVCIDLALLYKELGQEEEARSVAKEGRKVLEGQKARFLLEHMDRLGL